MSEFLHPADAAEFNEFINSAFWLGEACGSVEYRFSTGDSGWTLIESTARAIEHPQFGPAVVLDSCEKHHERFALSGALENELLRRAMFDNAAVGMAVLSPSGHVVETNRALREMLDHPIDELHGMALAELILPRDPEGDRRALAEVMSGRRDSYRFRNGYYMPNGDSVWGELTLVALPGDDGERCLMVIFEDPFAAKPEFEFCETSPALTHAHPATNVLDITRWKVARGLISPN
jgi:PAS domain S-box-containing protein